MRDIEHSVALCASPERTAFVSSMRCAVPTPQSSLHPGRQKRGIFALERVVCVHCVSFERLLGSQPRVRKRRGRQLALANLQVGSHTSDRCPDRPPRSWPHLCFNLSILASFRRHGWCVMYGLCCSHSAFTCQCTWHGFRPDEGLCAQDTICGTHDASAPFDCRAFVCMDLRPLPS